MPFITACDRNGALSNQPRDVVLRFNRGVLDIVAWKLSCIVPGPDGQSGQFEQLDPAVDLELRTVVLNTSMGDHSGLDVVLDIETLDYPDRVANLDDRAKEIREAVQGFADDNNIQLTVGVWLKAVRAAWSATAG
jgi:hypothetical protein